MDKNVDELQLCVSNLHFLLHKILLRQLQMKSKPTNLCWKLMKSSHLTFHLRHILKSSLFPTFANYVCDFFHMESKIDENSLGCYTCDPLTKTEFISM